MGGVLNRSAKSKESLHLQGPRPKQLAFQPIFDFSCLDQETSPEKRARMSVIGIDLGTQSSYIGTARAGGIEIVLNDYSLRDTPSYVSFHDKNRSMGVAAKGFLIGNIGNTVFNFKRFLGRAFKDPFVQEELKYLPFDIVETQDGGIAFKVKYLGKETYFSPEQVTGMFLGKLRSVSEADLKSPVYDCVISVPDYFGDAERRALLSAASIAGLNVLRLFNETTAVALTYGLYHQELPEPDQPSKNIIFVDVGYTTTQIGAVAFNRGRLKVLNTVVDPNLGGRNLDYVLLHHFAEDFRQKYKIDVLGNKRATMRLRDECEKLKKMMSSISNEIPINIECFMNDKDVSGKMKRDEFESLIYQELSQFENRLREMLNFMKQGNHIIDRVEIIGAGVRVPAIKHMIKQVFELEPSTSLNQDEAVCRGCAIQCAILSPTLKVKEFQVTDACPYGIELQWPSERDQKAGSLEVFPRNHASPASKFVTLSRSEPFVLEAYYSSNQEILAAKSCLGQFKIHDVKPATGETSTKVRIKTRIDGNGVFGVGKAHREEVVLVEDDAPSVQIQPMETDQNGLKNDATKADDAMEVETNAEQAVKKTKKQSRQIELRVEAEYPELSTKKVQEYVEQENEMQSQDKAEKEKSQAKNTLEEYIYEYRDKIQGEYGDYISVHDREKFSSMLTQAEDWLYSEGEDQPKSSYSAKLSELQAFGTPLTTRYREHQDRPGLLEDMCKYMQLTRKTVDNYLSGDEKFQHIEKKDIDRVVKILSEKQQWLDEKLNSQANRPLYAEPLVSLSQIRKEKEGMEQLISPILNKPKPVPKAVPPPPQVPKEGKVETEVGDHLHPDGPGTEANGSADVPMD